MALLVLLEEGCGLCGADVIGQGLLLVRLGGARPAAGALSAGGGAGFSQQQLCWLSGGT